MILGFGPIRLDRLLAGLGQQVDLDVLPAGRSPFSTEQGRQAVLTAVEDFRAFVEDTSPEEGELRRALCWLLTQSDAEIVAIHQSGAIPFPVGEAQEIRTYLELFGPKCSRRGGSMTSIPKTSSR